jgi:tetratricopeptide (TPR) repeat protein
VRRAYLNRTPASEVAATLGLSIRQYRRDQSDIIGRIACHVQRTKYAVLAPVVFPRLDALRFQMDCADHAMELGDPAGASAIYRHVLRAAPNVGPTIEALCRLAEASFEAGDPNSAASHLRDADAIFASDSNALGPTAREAARADLAFVRSSLEWREGRLGADESLASAVEALEPILPGAGVRVHALFTDVLMERAQRYADRGDFVTALFEVDRVTNVLDAIRDAPPRQRSDAMRLRTVIGMKSDVHTTRPRDSFAAISEALELARRCGSAKRVVLASVSLALLHRYSEAITAAYITAERSVGMMRLIASMSFRASVAPTLGSALLHTRHSKFGFGIVSDIEQLYVEGSMAWIRAEIIKAEYYLRLGEWAKSFDLSHRCEAYARTLRAPRRQADALRCMAWNAHRLGRTAEAGDYLAGAVELVNRYGSGLSRTLTLQAATAIDLERT